ncbi:MAG: hypothetical protein M3R51_06825 [Candidatus Eremiobacteraeota bacterium]|nr:hypothetical protein [Candidatus Eremiobacteraeota bacterium]
MLEDVLRGPLSHHAIAPPALQPFDGLDDAMREVAEAIGNDPTRSELHAAIGNGFIRRTRYLEAMAAYRAALDSDPSNAPARLALSELMSIAGDPGCLLQLQEALRQRRVYADSSVAEKPTALLLLRDAPYSTNAPLDLIVDRSEIAMHRCYVQEDDCTALPPFDVIFCAFGYARAAQKAIDRAECFAERCGVPTINEPAKLIACARENLSKTLQCVTGISVPEVSVCAPSEVLVRGTTLVRPVDTHAGMGLALVGSAQEFLAHHARWDAAYYHVAPFIDYASADGYYRKYRIALVDGAAYPYHLAISPRWMVHYRNAPMAQHEWMREEEAAFLADPHRVFPEWAVFAQVAKAIGLDYVGVDCAQLLDGSMLIFEADPAMLFHDEDPAGVFAYKRACVAEIRRALTAMMVERAGARGTRRKDGPIAMRQERSYGHFA